VEDVVEDRVALLGRGGERLDEAVERALGVEHHDGHRAGHLDPGAREERRVDALRRRRHLLEAEALREAAGRIDREAQDALAAAGGGEPERGGRGRLADAAAADDEDHPTGVEQGAEAGSRRRHGQASSTPQRRPWCRPPPWRPPPCRAPPWWPRPPAFTPLRVPAPPLNAAFTVRAPSFTAWPTSFAPLFTARPRSLNGLASAWPATSVKAAASRAVARAAS